MKKQHKTEGPKITRNTSPNKHQAEITYVTNQKKMWQNVKNLRELRPFLFLHFNSTM